MNKYFDQNDIFNSNRRTYKGYFTETKKEKSAFQKWLEKVIALLSVLMRTISESSALRTVKVIGVAVSLIGFIGIIGAMEQGTLGMGSGLLIGSLLLLVEYLCLKGRRQDS
jgi:hypothetical protein